MTNLSGVLNNFRRSNNLLLAPSYYGVKMNTPVSTSQKPAFRNAVNILAPNKYTVHMTYFTIIPAYFSHLNDDTVITAS